jgi:hypothetical protein
MLFAQRKHLLYSGVQEFPLILDSGLSIYGYSSPRAFVPPMSDTHISSHAFCSAELRGKLCLDRWICRVAAITAAFS